MCAGSPAADRAQSAAVEKLLAVGETQLALVAVLTDVPARPERRDSVPAIFGGVSQLACRTADAAKSLAQARLDVLLDFSGERLTGELLDAAVNGVWRWTHTVDPRNNLSIATLVRL